MNPRISFEKKLAQANWWEKITIFELEDHEISLDQNNVYFDDIIISQQPNKFIGLSRRSLWYNYFKDDSKLFIHSLVDRSPYDFQIKEYDLEEIWFDDFEIIDDEYAIASNWFFARWNFVPWAWPFERIGKFLTTQDSVYNDIWHEQVWVDRNTFRIHESQEESNNRPNFTLYTDVYWVYWTIGTGSYTDDTDYTDLAKITSDIDGFEIADRAYMDTNSVYLTSNHGYNKIVWADPGTRRRLDLEIYDWMFNNLNDYSVDKNNMYRKNKIVEWIDLDSVQSINGGIYELALRIKDNSNVFYQGRKVEWVDISTREIVWPVWWNFGIWEQYYSRDKSNVYYLGQILQWASPDTFELINNKVAKRIYKWDKHPIIDGELIQTDIETFLPENGIDDIFYPWSNWVFTMLGSKLEFLEAENVSELTQKDDQQINQNKEWVPPMITLSRRYNTVNITDSKYFIAQFNYSDLGHAWRVSEFRVLLLPEITNLLDDIYDNLNSNKRVNLHTKLNSIKSSSQLFSTQGSTKLDKNNKFLDLTTNEMLVYQIVNYLDEKIGSDTKQS